ncbi:ATP-binding protein [Neorhizobium sp. NPDC001467]|uniref:PAS domain-containing sensor histidine kinase n=1 Tax=Neorhizobium sp. NPDC001467 TaxID=3390595 RepID=UPI003D0395BA
MSAVQYPFIDIAVHPRIRARFSGGEAIVIFSPDMKHALWANGRGAELFGHENIYDFLDHGTAPVDVSFRQAEAAARGLKQDGESRAFVMRVTSGFQRTTVTATCERVTIGRDHAIMVAAPAPEAAISPIQCAARMIEGFDDTDTHRAVLDQNGQILAASPRFSALDLTPHTARMLVNMAAVNADGLVKRPVPTRIGYLPAAMGKVSDDPAMHLLFIVEPDAESGLAIAMEDRLGGEEAAGAIDPPAHISAPPARQDRSADGYVETLDALADIADVDDEPVEEAEFRPSDASTSASLEKGSATEQAMAEVRQALQDSFAAHSDARHDADNDAETPASSADGQPDATPVSEAAHTDAAPVGPTRASDTPSTAAEGFQIRGSKAEGGAAGTFGPQTSDKDTSGPGAPSMGAPDMGPSDAGTSGPRISGEWTAAANASRGGTGDPTDRAGSDAATTPATPATMFGKARSSHAEPFVFSPDMRATRFVWKIDAEGRFSEVSSEFARVVGPHAADIAGLSFSDLAALFNFDPDGKIGELLRRRDTWSGKTIWWPIEGTTLKVPVDLAALPTYTRSREFDGFRGFGIVRVADAAEDPLAIGITLTPAPSPAEMAPLPQEGEESLNDAVVDTASQAQDGTQPEIERQTAWSHATSGDPEPAGADAGFEAVDSDDGGYDAGNRPGKGAGDDSALAQDVSPVAAAGAVSDPRMEKPALRLADTPTNRHSDKVIRFEERRFRRDGLTPGEQAAFVEIGRRLDPQAAFVEGTVDETGLGPDEGRAEQRPAQEIWHDDALPAAARPANENARRDSETPWQEMPLADRDAQAPVEQTLGAASEKDREPGTDATTDSITAARQHGGHASDVSIVRDADIDGDAEREADPATADPVADAAAGAVSDPGAEDEVEQDPGHAGERANPDETLAHDAEDNAGDIDDRMGDDFVEHASASDDGANEAGDTLETGDLEEAAAAGGDEATSGGTTGPNGQADADATDADALPLLDQAPVVTDDRAPSDSDRDEASPDTGPGPADIIPVRARLGLTADILDQMPVALLVHAGDRLFHANAEFLRLTGYDSLQQLEALGGLDVLLQRDELEATTAEAGGMVVVRADDTLVPVSARLQSIRFEQSTALMLALMPVAATTALKQAPSAPTASARFGSEPGLAEPVTPSPAHADVTPASDERAVDEGSAAAAAAAAEVSRLQVEVDELRSILETATDGVVIIGSEGDVRSMNKAASALFNYDNDETAGRPFVMLFAHESQRSVIDYLGGLAGHGVASVLNDGREVIGREAGGGFLPLFMTIGRLTSSNGYCAVIRDITQWKRTEEELRNAKRAAETANAHKSDFLAHVSHEIRTPLNAIIGFADMMATERFGPIGHPRYIEYANDIGRSGRHVLDIVNDLLDISKIEAGEMDLEFEAVGLNETVSEAVSIIQPQANGQRVIIRSALSQAVPQVVADLRSIKQIVLNILSNAIRFTPSGGQIVVSTALEPNGNVILRIRDTGIGMTRSELEMAMQPFRQVTGAARKRGDGTGLGLPLTKAMVDANRASFAISSTPNEGTLVEITFPSPRVLAN